MEEVIEFDGAEEAVAQASEPVRLSLDEVIAKMKTGLTEMRTRPMRDAPDGYRYIFGPHLGPNHDMRRRSRLAQERRFRNYMSWRRQLERVGINPDEVLAKRKERAHASRLAARGLGTDVQDLQRDEAAS